MNLNKVAVVAVVAVLVVAAGAFIVMKENNHGDDKKHALSVVARVNTDGSGIYLKADINPESMYKDGKFIKEGWGGKVFGTPGPSTIQHVQLSDIVKEMGLGFEKYSEQTKKADTVYYVDSVNNRDAATTKVGALLDGGILWEPQYSMIAADAQYQEFLLTNDLFPGHTCCVIAGNQKFLDSERQAAVAFLSSYVKAVKYVNDAKKNPESSEFAELMKICKKYTSGLEEDTILAALTNVQYKFSDDNAGGSLAVLAEDIAALEDSLSVKGGPIKEDIKNYGFADAKAFGKALVDDSFLKDAMNAEPVNVGKKIKVAAIDGDIHQIAIRVAQDLGYFGEWGLEVTVTSLANGRNVALDILSNQSDIAFLGAPPLTINVVNGGYLKA